MKKKLEVPEFKSIEEEATFWDTHDSGNFPDYWQPAPDVKFSKNLVSVYVGDIPVKIDEDTMNALQKVAKKKRMNTSETARMLIRERLSELKVI